MPGPARAVTKSSNVVNAFLYAYERGAGTNPLATGQLGNYLGCEFYVTANGSIFASAGFSGAYVYGSLLIGDGAYGVVDLTADQARTYFKPRGSGGATGDPVDQVWFGKGHVIPLYRWTARTVNAEAIRLN